AKWFTSVMFDQEGTGWIAADTHLLVSEDGGESWKAVSPSDTRLFLSAIVRTGDAVWAVGQYGVLRKQVGELAWRQVEQPDKLVLPPSRYDTSRPATTAALARPAPAQ
ncbi:MAG TPA: hypothetical protein PLK67_20810, partial [Bryobacteraceae bacterium]|nr:hypothetical protein [Bryobacteraceae bacterium]